MRLLEKLKPPKYQDPDGKVELGNNGAYIYIYVNGSQKTYEYRRDDVGYEVYDTITTTAQFNSPGTIVCSTDNFPFWAKILTDFTATCYNFEELISNPNPRQSVLVLWNVIRFWISVIT